MLIAHNMMASNAMRQFKISGNNKKKATEKLTSGYRINRASDDAAGLSISEKMRGQIRGLTQGVRNVEDGISLCQVADGALSEVTSMLQRITELSVQSANDTNTDEDRNAIQNEIGELLEEIDRICDTTSFNERKLFAGAEKKIIGYRPETITNTITVPMTDSFSFNVSGESTESELGTYTITSDTSLSSGIVINDGTNNTTITWDKVKGQGGDVINLDDIQEGTYSFDYKGMHIDFSTNRNINADQLITGITGVKWTTKEGTPYEMKYDFQVSCREYKDAIYNGVASPKIKFKDDGVYIRRSRDYSINKWEKIDYPVSIEEIPTPGTITFQLKDSFTDYSFSLSIPEGNTMSYKDIFEDINNNMVGIAPPGQSWQIFGADLIRTGSYARLTCLRDNEIIDEEEYNRRINLLNEHPGSSVGEFWADSYGIHTTFFGVENEPVSWEKLFSTAVIGEEETTFFFKNDCYEIEFSVFNSILDDQDWFKYDINHALNYNHSLTGFQIHIEYDSQSSYPTGAFELVDPEAKLYSCNVKGQQYHSWFYGYRGYEEDHIGASANKSIPSIWADTVTDFPEYTYNTTKDVDSVIQTPIYEDEPDPIERLWIQYGANSGQALQIELDTMNTTALGINGLNVTTRDGANNAISLSQQAVQKVTESRSKIGAYQNRMEHIVDNENNMIENTQAAESRIRDSDMAKEMVDLAKQQILEQVGTSMITQANQNTQGILKLLQ